MKRYIVRWQEGGEEREREFATKKDAFKWFNWDCPAEEAWFEETTPDGGRTAPKKLRRQGAAAGR